MISEEVFYLFIFPWMAVIASVPGVMITFLMVGIVGQLLNYLPSEKDQTKE